MNLGGSWSNSKSFMPTFGHLLELFQWATEMCPKEPASAEGWVVEQNKNENGKI